MPHYVRKISLIYPKTGKPWLFGMHQCSHPRIWKNHEQHLFKEIGRRLADALSSLIIQRNLRESEKQFRQLAENIPEVFWVGSPDWREILYISPAYEKIWGRSAQSLYEQPLSWFEAIHPEDQEKVKAAIPRDIESIDHVVVFPEFRVVRPDRSERWVLARAFPVRNFAGKVEKFTGIAEDITERKNGVIALQASEKRYRELFENLIDVSYRTRDMPWSC
jgi:PAS domain S-box-containing protein